MQLTTLLLIISLTPLSAAVFGQRITLNKQNISLKTVLREITHQSGYGFFYDSKVIGDNQRLDVTLSKVTLNEALNTVLAGLKLSYSIDGKIVSIKKLEEPLLSNNTFSSQSINIRGRVVDELGQPLVGATIAMKTVNRFVKTDQNGDFYFGNVRVAEKLLISFVGYKSIEVEAKEKMGIIRMKPTTSQLAEVSVISTGFQTISKERATGSYGVISKEQLEKPTTNIAQRLIGQVSGLQAKSMDVNGNPVFEIRGQSSLLANATPLIVVDGFPIQGDFNSVNPNDIESVTVLKDAAAASVWGARSANGVIVITTKSASKGAPMKVEFNAFTSIGAKFDMDYVRPLASSTQTVDYEILAYGNWRATADPQSVLEAGQAYSRAGILLNEAKYGHITTAQRDAGLEALRKLDNRKQISDHLFSNPTSRQYNLSLSGGSEKMSNNLSLMHERNQSNFKESNNKRYMVNFRNNSEITNWLGINLNAVYIYNKANNNGVDFGLDGSPTAAYRPLQLIQNMSPYDMLMNPDGSLTDVNQYYTPLLQQHVPMAMFPYADWSFNPIQEIANRDRTTEQTQARLQAALNFKIVPGLSAALTGQYEIGNGSIRNLSNENTFEVRRTVNQATTWNRATSPNTFTLNLPKGSILNQSRNRAASYNIRGQLNFNRNFTEKHEVNFLSGMEFQNATVETFTNPTSYGFNEETLGVGTFPNGPGGAFYPIRNWLGSTQTFSYVNTFGYNTQRLFSAYGNGAYTYDGKYTLSGSYRVDASNLITDDPQYRYDPFFSMGASWQVYKEQFMSNIQWVDRLTTRLTYGHTGNYDANTAVRPLISPSASSDIFINDFTATFSSFGNPTLRWERTAEWNLGIDFAFFKNKLFGRIDLYDKRGKDLIASLTIPSVYGTVTQRLNNAAMTNQGVNVELGTSVNITKDLNWRGNLAGAYNKNRITDLFMINYNPFVLARGGTGAYVVGADANSMWRFKYAGVVDDIPTVFGPDGTKIDYYSTVAGNGVEFMQNMGTLVAPYDLSFMSSFRYKDLDLSFIITSKFGHVFQRTGFNYPALMGGRVLPNMKLNEVMNADPNKIAPMPPQAPSSTLYSWSSVANGVDYLIESASHVRMQEINLSYNIPTKILAKTGFKRLRVYAQGNNLFVLYANKAGEDPEFLLGTMRPMPRYTFGLRFEY